MTAPALNTAFEVVRVKTRPTVDALARRVEVPTRHHRPDPDLSLVVVEAIAKASKSPPATELAGLW